MNWLYSLAAFGGSLFLSVVAVCMSIHLAHRWNILDHPDMPRKTQTAPIPKLGGVAVAVAFIIASLAVIVFMGQRELVIDALAILVPALGAALLGFIDDRRHLNPYFRLVSQAALAMIAWGMGLRLSLTGNDFIDLIIFVVWIMAIVNATNLLDNSDGLAATTVAISAFGAFSVALLAGQTLVSTLAAAVAGAAVGFLWFNWSPARVYLGDAGAYFLGFLLAVLVVQVSPVSAPPPVGALVTLLLVALPLADLIFVVVRRLRVGVHPFTAGRDHLSHVLQARGCSIPGSVVRLEAIELLGVGGAILLAWIYI